MKEILKYVKSDFIRYGYPPSWMKIVVCVVLVSNPSFCYSFWLRLASGKNIVRFFARYKHKQFSRKYGIEIPIGTKIGYGLYLSHGVGIIINGSAVIGNNCNLSQFTTIGSNEGKAALIGDNVYIGPSVCIVEYVAIGDNATIGAGAVITKDIPKNATVAGVPGDVLNFNNPGRYILNRYTTY